MEEGVHMQGRCDERGRIAVYISPIASTISPHRCYPESQSRCRVAKTGSTRPARNTSVMLCSDRSKEEDGMTRRTAAKCACFPNDSPRSSLQVEMAREEDIMTTVELGI
ncbi:uncharacterized protein MYCFIDRAFT_175675 [Pseudocercospora fijiensis CIRAD86]|uniref:Uncharacterized protein n=1 Tax=Pseudocercospora fijiensis (strain CIRAD86) TaxID=383855 RepID=M3AXC4_PSEFD|nr:uncharacterized protein MYCFIDRAFT_175675 [Pseudocercospora fijiensis CIRAD86]EME82127.1 hypothetical protein MYCFIDRAFT_175675 [Pseudocercospora fijiensis CIRAD86]